MTLARGYAMEPPNRQMPAGLRSRLSHASAEFGPYHRLPLEPRLM
jgi:hypothetical protein